MQQKNSKEDRIKKSLARVLTQDEIPQYQELIKRLSAELQISFLDCAAALLLLNQPNLYSKKPNNNNIPDKISPAERFRLPKQKVVRYRLDIGKKHLVSLEDIKNVLVEVSGVEGKQIKRLDVRNYYTLVDLPDGMPADIFQLLSESEINQQRFKIKRIKSQRRFQQRNFKKPASKPHVV
ncbi:MAG: DbpA RNA binding domain-containing protein [Methylococcaceae bacterium]